MRGLLALLTLFLCLPAFGQSLVHTNLVQPLGNKTIVGTNALKFSVLATNAATPASGNLTIFARTNDSSQVKFFSIDSAGTVREWGSGSGSVTNLDDLADVDAASPSVGHVLQWNGTVWTNAASALGAATNILAANTLFVDAVNGNDTTATKGRQDLPWQTIQAASSNMSSGNLMFIRPGAYTVSPDPSGRTSFPNLGALIRFQNLTNIAIIGDDATLTAAYDGNIILFQNVTNAYITGLNIEGAGANRGTNNFGAIILDGTNKFVTIHRNQIRNVGAHGVVTLHNQHASDYVSVTENTFETGGSGSIPTLSYDGTAIATGGRYWDISGNTIRDWFRGVEFYTAGTNEVAHNRVVGNTIDKCWESAIIVIPTTNAGEKHHHNTLSDNVIHGPLYPLKSSLPGVPSGIVLQGGMHNVISGNIISNMASFSIFVTNSGTGEYDTNAYVAAGGYGIRLGSEAGVSKYNLVEGNQVSAIRYRAIDVIGTTYENVGNLITDNYVYYAHDTAGVWLYGTSNAVVSGNVVFASVTGTTVEISTNATVVGNTFFNNGSYGIHLKSTAVNSLAFGNSLYNNAGGFTQLYNESGTSQIPFGNVRDKYGVFNGVNSDASTPTFGWTNAQANGFIQLHNGLTTNQTGNVNQYGSDWRIYSTVYGPAGLQFYNGTSNRTVAFFDGLHGRMLVGDINPGNFGPVGQLNVYANTNHLTRERHLALTGRDYFRGTNGYSLGTNSNSGISLLLYTQGFTNKTLMVADTDHDTDTNDATAINLTLKPYWGEVGAMYLNSNYAALTLRGSTVKMPHLTPSSLLRVNASGEIDEVTIGSNISFDGTTLSATGGGTNASNVYVNGAVVSAPNLKDGTYSVFYTGSTTNVFLDPTNIVNAQISGSANIAATKLESAVIVSTEIDSSSEIAGIVLDETGTGALVYSSAPNLTNTVAYTLLNVTNGVLSMSGPLQYTSETISASDIDWSTGNSFYKQLTANTTFTFSGQQNDYNIRVFLEQDGTGGRTVTWPASVVWLSTTNQSTTAPNVDTNANRVTIVDFFRRNGTNYGTAFGANARPLEDIANVVSAAAGDILYYTGTVWTNLARGSTGQVLTTTNNTIQWLNAAAGTGSGDVSFTDLNTNQFDTNNATYKIAIKSGATVTNLSLVTPKNATFTNLTVLDTLTVNTNFSVLGTLSADAMVISNWFQIPNLTNITVPSTTNGYLALDLDSDYSGVTNALLKYSAHGQSNWVVAVPGSLPSANGKIPKYNSTTKAFEWADDATGAGGGDPVLVNSDAVADGSGVAFTNTSTLVWELDTATTPDLAKAYPTNLGAAQLATDSVSADELNAAGVATELEAAMALQDISGAVTDSQVPNNITIDLATTATTANAGDSATAFFSAGQIERARGGTGADTSAYGDGLIGSNSGNSTIDIDTISEFSTALGITGTPSASTYLRGDGTWATVSGSGDVSYTAFDPNQFGTNGGSIYIKDGAVVTNLNVRNNLTVTNAITAQSVTISNLTASQYVVTDANKQLATQSTLNDDDVAFDDADNLWTATAVGPALEELNDSINAGSPNGTGAKVHWSQLLGVPAGFADNTDDGGGGGDAVQVNGLAVTDALFTNSTTIVWYTNGTASTEILGYVTNVGAAQLATDSVSADELNAAGVESELEAVLDLPDLQGVLVTAQLPTAYLGSWQITNALSVYDLTISNNFTIVSNLNAGSLYVTNDAVFKNVLTTNLYLTNGLTSGALFVGSGGLVTNQGTLDGSSTGVTLKFKQYIRLTHPHHGSASAIIQTNNVNNEYFGYALFDDATDEASNYTEYHITVPEDIDTSVDLRVKLYYTTSAADTGTHKYVISHQDVADSADLFTVAMVEPVTLTDTAAGAGAGDTEIVGWTTLTSWRSNITAGNMWVIRIARDGNDASDGSTVDSYVSQIVIEYGATQ